MNPFGLKLISQLSAAGDGGAETLSFLFSANVGSPLKKRAVYSNCGETFVGEVSTPLEKLPSEYGRFCSRISQIALKMLKASAAKIEKALAIYDPSRVGVVIGSSTSGIGAAEDAFQERKRDGKFPSWYRYEQQEIGAIASFIASYLKISGPAFTVSTACSSGAKALSSARGLIEAGFCDAVITGGIDSLCSLTVGGFHSLELLSPELSNPFSKNRSGLNIGEGGALFLLSKSTDAPFLLRGIGEASDAYHISSPHPEGAGAIESIKSALTDSGASTKDVGYMNLHGTGTVFNDLMESKAVNSVFGAELPCSSTKPITGHTLGAAGAIELAFCCLALQEKAIPVHRFDNEIDPELSPVALAIEPSALNGERLVLSSSFAFGGSNCCLAISAS